MSLNKFLNIWVVNLEVLQGAFMGKRKVAPDGAWQSLMGTCSGRRLPEGTVKSFLSGLLYSNV